MKREKTIAYFSMEIALTPAVPTYSGGLGVLAGDTIRSAADLGVPMVALTLLHRRGYFYQKLDAAGVQTEEPEEWAVDDFLKELPARAAITIEGRPVAVRAWEFEVAGAGGSVVPVYLLDTDLPENDAWARTLTDQLYGGDTRYRLAQEAVLGIGGVRMLRALGYDRMERYHMNEGHAALLALELLDELARIQGVSDLRPEDIDTVREQCVFTTHTPVPAGHDQFPLDLVERVLGRLPAPAQRAHLCCDGVLNMTYLALNLSHYVNGVAKKHGEVSRLMFAQYRIDSITNGVHAATWTSPPFQALFDRYIPGWREDNFSLRYALSIPGDEVWQAHGAAKRALFHYIQRAANVAMDTDCLTIGFARRAAPYKRADLLFDDLAMLTSLAAPATPLQLVFAGKAHPRDEQGKALIARICRARDALRPAIKMVYLPSYDMELGRLLTSGVDVWLNTPEPPLEASGTSGMKAALNGVPSLSILDGWWIEGCIEGITGWSIGVPATAPAQGDRRAADAASLYDALARKVIPLYYTNRKGFLSVMLHAMALNGSFFNTQRMVQQYVLRAYYA
jgi:glycogen phosphorylase